MTKSPTMDGWWQAFGLGELKDKNNYIYIWIHVRFITCQKEQILDLYR